MRTLSRYLLRQHVAPFAFALVALTAILLLNQVAKRFGDFVGKGIPWTVVAEFFTLTIPFILAMTFPMAVLVAVLYTWSRLAEDNEYMALLAGGISPLRLARPVALAGIIASFVTLGITDHVLPRSNHRLRMLMVDIQRKKPNFVLKEQVVNEVTSAQLFLRAARISAASDRLGDVTIYDMQQSDRRRVIHADSGRLAYANGFRDLYLTLHDGVVLEFQRTEPARFSQSFFATQVLRVEGVGDTLERTTEDSYHTDRELSVCAMDARMIQAELNARQARADLARVVRTGMRVAAGLPTLAPDPPVAARRPLLYCRLGQAVARWLAPTSAEAQAPRVAGAATTAADMTALRQRAEAAVRDASGYAVEVHKKFVLSAACFVFVLIGIPLALRFPRGGVGLVIGAGLAVFTTYYVCLIVGEDLGDRLIVNPALAMWLPNLLYALLGAWGLRQLARGAVAVAGQGLGGFRARGARRPSGR